MKPLWRKAVSNLVAVSQNHSVAVALLFFPVTALKRLDDDQEFQRIKIIMPEKGA
jgi:hypothetical protein